jgi:hypothetical protein
MNSILITGGSGKVGFQLVNHFLQQDYTVVTTSRSKESFLKKRGAELKGNWEGKLKIIEVDFAGSNAVGTILGFLKEHAIDLKTVVHNARSLEFLKIEKDTSVSDENFAGEFYMDVIFPYRLTLEILKTNLGLNNVVFISSMYGVVAPTPGLYENFPESSPINYGVSKAAQIHLTKELAVRLGPEVRVNCVSFGGIKGRANLDFEKRYHKLAPQQKMLEEHEVVGPVDYLVSESSRNMTGQNLIIDGGWTIW